MKNGFRETDRSDPRRIVAQRAGSVVAIVLLLAAIWLLWRQRDTVGAALGAVRSADPIDFAMLLGGVVANVVLSAAVLQVLLRRYGPVGGLEMQAVVASATMLNSVPMRPGTFGRVAYHRVVNGIAVVDTARSVLEAVAITVAIALWLAGVAVVSTRFDISLWYGVALPLPILLLGASFRPPRTWLLAAVLRYLEVLVWAVRYHAAFRLIGSPIDPTVALAFACVSTIASMVPFLAGGLGLREWAIGLLAPILADVPLELGVTGDLLNRAAAVVVIGTIGIPSTVWVVRRMRRACRPETASLGTSDTMPP